MVDNWKKAKADFANIVSSGNYDLDPLFMNVLVFY